MVPVVFRFRWMAALQLLPPRKVKDPRRDLPPRLDHGRDRGCASLLSLIQLRCVRALESDPANPARAQPLLGYRRWALVQHGAP